ncbi:hypothetical protein LOD99_5206 [Oopsacas minuta]|uniref:Uncharacterized protein n=1 Tax=Oopsacas minuta TaxID=111878 RepID=A0AAV7JSD5_9METZ|nr:hypothetical protein LOD99_5206 [Oopsacas minuta]
MCNNFHLVVYGIPTTINVVEAWQRTLSLTVASHHPTIWKFCEALKIEQASIELKQAQYYSDTTTSKSKASLEKEFSMVILVMSYYTRPLLTSYDKMNTDHDRKKLIRLHKYATINYQPHQDF